MFAQIRKGGLVLSEPAPHGVVVEQRGSSAGSVRGGDQAVEGIVYEIALRLTVIVCTNDIASRVVEICEHTRIRLGSKTTVYERAAARQTGRTYGEAVRHENGTGSDF